MKVVEWQCCVACCALCFSWSSASVEEDFRRLQESCKQLKDKTVKLKYSLLDLREENEKLMVFVRNMRQEMNDIETYYRTENLELVGVPRLEGEDLTCILRNISEVLELPFREEDVSAAWRQHEVSGDNYYKRTETDYIIVRFVSRTLRNQWLRRGRDRIVIYSRDCLPALPESEIYINEHLTNTKKGLIKLAKNLEKEGKIAYAWVKDGHLYIRRIPLGRAIKIKSYYDFKLMGLIDKF